MNKYLTGGLFANVSHLTNVKEVVTHLIKERPEQILCSITESNLDILEEYFKRNNVKYDPPIISNGGRKKEVEITGLSYDEVLIAYKQFVHERKPKSEPGARVKTFDFSSLL